MRKVWIVNGSPRSGKDTFCDYVARALPDDVKAKTFSTIDALRNIACLCMGYNESDKSPEGRRFLSELKRITTEYNNLSFNETKRIVENCTGVLFIHCREPKEIDKIKALDSSIQTVFVERGSRVWGNASDDDVDKYIYDIYVSNTGTLDDLRDKAKEFVSKYC